MHRFPGIVLILCTATIIAVPPLAHGEVDPDTTFEGIELSPFRFQGFGGSFNVRPELYYDYQPQDCDKAGSSGLQPLIPGAVQFPLDGHFSLYSAPQYDLGDVFPGEGSGQDLRNYGADQGPLQGGVDESASGARDYLRLDHPDGPFDDLLREAFEESVDRMLEEAVKELRSNFNSVTVETPIGQFPSALDGFVNQQYDLYGTTFSSLLVPQQDMGDVAIELVANGVDFYGNPCWKVQVPSDPNYRRTGRNGGNSWGSKLDDQWAIKRIGLTADEDSAWNLVPADAQAVTVAVIDTGLDWHHLDIDPANIWRNTREIPSNGVDDDQNGYVDDIIGWDFMGKHGRPWDFDGHGTLVAGIIAAAHNNVGIAGINPNAKIMVLKAVGNFGTTRPSYIAEAIVYAVDNGARVINISVGGEYANRMVQAAVDWAHQQGVLVVAAAGNEGVELDDYGPAGGEHVLTVGATHDDNRGTGFANYGDKIDIAAPGVDVLSLRARFTDANYRPNQQEEGEYEIGDYFVGEDKRYMRANGTSFSAPIVSGVASLVMAKNPQLSGAEVAKILMETATDVDFPGNDKYTGNGMVDARAALSVDPDFSVTAEITRVEFSPPEDPQVVVVYGTVDASEFKRAWIKLGPGENPGGWRYAGPKHKHPVRNGELGIIKLDDFYGNDLWQVVVNVEHKNGVVKRAAFPITIK